MRKNVRRYASVVATSLFTLVPASALQPPDAAYVKDFDKWKAELVDDLKQNWLPLAGLFWLKPGDSVFGSDSNNPIVSPSVPVKLAGSFARVMMSQLSSNPP